MWRRGTDLARRWGDPCAALWGATLLLWLWVAVPLVTGHETLYYRDVLWTHAHFKAFGAEQLLEGRIPAFNPTWALGQPFRGNPNTLAFYPGNLLYLVLPFAAAFHLHYMLHWLLALGAMWLLARQLGQGRPAALCAGLTYAGSGWMLSALTFYNILTVSAWWPLVLWGVARGDRRGLTAGGVACGFAVLGGEPVTLAIGLVPLALLAGQRHGWRGGVARLAAVGAVAALVALPQIVATLRVLGFTFRGGHGLLAIDLDAYSLHPVRLLELLVPLPFGSPAVAGSEGFWANPMVPRVPYVLTIHCGIVALALALTGSPRRRPWAGLALAGLGVAWLGGVWGEQLLTVSAGLFRTSEKFLFWLALAVPLLAGWGVERITAESARPARLVRWIAASAVALVTLGGASAWLAPRLASAVAGSPGRAGGAAATVAGVTAHAAHWTLSLLSGGALLLLLAWAVRSRRPAAAVALQWISLLALAPLVMTTGDDLLGRPGPLADRLPAGTGVVSSVSVMPAWEEGGVEVRGPQSVVTRAWIDSLASPTGVLAGLSYPMGHDLEGMHSPLFKLMSFNLGRDDWPARVTWCRALGVGALVTRSPVASPHLRQLAKTELHGSPFRLYEVFGSAPEVWWPATTEVATSPADAFRRVSRLGDPVAAVVTSRPVEHSAGATVRVLSRRPDRVEVEVRGQGGVLAVRQSYHPLWRATAGGERLGILPVNLHLLGVEVPPGEHRIVLGVAWWPEALAGVVALLALAGALRSARC